MTGPNTLTFFEVTGNFNAIANPNISGVINSPIIQPVNALVTFTPRLAQGQLMYVEDYLVTEAYNAEQTINLLGNPISGTYILEFGGQFTDPLAFDATPEQVQTALEGLSSIGAGNISVSADIEPLAYDVEFLNDLGNQGLPVINGNADLLDNDEGQGFCEITVTPTAMGSPQIIADTAIAAATITGRIWSGVLSTIDRTDTPGIQLLANSEILNLGAEQLIYDVAFTKVTYNEGNQTIAPFAFVASVDDTPVCITNPNLEMQPYVAPNQPPYSGVWVPPGRTPLNVVYVGNDSGRATTRDWRTRSAG
jgi:hypothetical protein